MRVLLCLLFVPFTALSNLSIGGPKRLTVQTGEDVWLTCLIRVGDQSLDATQLIVHWSKNGFDKAIFNGTPRYGPPGSKLSIKEFAKGNVSLFLPSVKKMTDQGMYLCDIQYAESKGQHYINLNVQDAKVPASELRSREEGEQSSLREEEKAEEQLRPREEREKVEEQPRSRQGREKVEEQPRSREERENMKEQPRPTEETEKVEKQPRSREETEKVEEQPRSREETENVEEQPRSREENETVEEQSRPREEKETVEEQPRPREEKETVEEQLRHEKVEEQPRLREKKEKKQQQQQQEGESWGRVKWYLQVGMVLGVLMIGLLVAVVIAVIFKG
ncbi:vicilin-like seed storage protein At2g18540 [Microcaecilia unicolor]|uniref:Vicilin-like seed storage protein At2g18540 n=1 Tax=Microcaecilia unicolor TaxID=1415580 RepID=A0A6P7YSJ9_9AMPH|nr:vicilin-like seed storage protein At2g18540 [Microcaecilia unicolor]